MSVMICHCGVCVFAYVSLCVTVVSVVSKCLWHNCVTVCLWYPRTVQSLCGICDISVCNCVCL